jgi:hypothetical protein
MDASATSARLRVSSWRVRAKCLNRWELSGSIGTRLFLGDVRWFASCVGAGFVGAESSDDGLQVPFDGSVHLGHPMMAFPLGMVDQRSGRLKLAVVLG